MLADGALAPFADDPNVLREPSMKKHDQGMTVERLTVSLEGDLAAAIRDAAEADQSNVSAWLAEAAKRRLAQRGFAAAIREWELENGAFTVDELAAARRELTQ